MSVRTIYLSIATATLLSVVPAVALAEAPPANWQQMIDEKLEGYLKDPYSAVKKVTRGPRFGTVREDAYTTWTGWAVCYSINAKNGYGAYRGAKDFVFVVGKDGVIGMLDKPESMWTGGIMQRECALPADPVETAEPTNAGEAESI